MYTEKRMGDRHEAEPTLQPPVTARTTAVVVLAFLVALFSLRAASDVFLPLVIAIIASLSLEPAVALLVRFRIPRSLAAAMVLTAGVATLGAGGWALSDEALAVADSLPAAVQKVRLAIRTGFRGPDNPMGTVQELATEIEKAAAEAAGPEPPPVGVTRVQVEEKPIDVRSYLWQGGVGLFSGLGTAVLILFLVYFLLASGDLYRRKLIGVAGTSLARRRVTLDVLQQISESVQQFLWVQIVTSAFVAAASWAAFTWFGLQQAGIWALAAGVFNSIPYFGPVIVTGAIALVAFMQFDSFYAAGTVAGAAAVITSLEGFLLTPWLVGRAARMNEVAVFTSLLFWGWMWGITGMLLAVPMMMAVKVICDRVEPLKPVGELLGN